MTTDLLADRWSALLHLLADRAGALAADGVLELLLPDTGISLTWLTPDRLLLSLHSQRVVGLGRRGWTGGAGTWHLVLLAEDDHREVAGQAAAAVLDVVRTVLRAGPDDLELRMPRASGQEALW